MSGPEEPIDDNPKTRFGMTKPGMACVPPGALIPLMQAMADGRRKYGLMNWREKTVSASIYYDAALRHLMAWWDGENTAEDSGVHHLGHAMACMAIVLDAFATGKINDDRPVAGPFSALVAAHTKKAPEAAADVEDCVLATVPHEHREALQSALKKWKETPPLGMMVLTDRELAAWNARREAVRKTVD